MSIYQSLDENELHQRYEDTISNIQDLRTCKKIDFTLNTKDFELPFTITFMWNGDELYY